MTQPTPFDRGYSFTDYQSSNPSAPPPGPKLDNELDRAAETFSDILRNLALIQRDDGQLKDASVGVDQLGDNLLYAIAIAVALHSKGSDAPRPNFNFEVSTLTPGQQATVEVTGAYPNLTVALGIPKGEPSLGGATLADIDYGDVLVTNNGLTMTVQAVGGEAPFRPSNKPGITDVTGLQAALDSAVGDWDTIANKPETFPPDAHTHAIADVTGLQTALDGKQPVGTYVDASAIAGKADAFTAIESWAASQTVNDADHNGRYNIMTGPTTRTLTFGSTPGAGHCSLWVNRGTAAMTIACPGGYWKDGAISQATANFSLSRGQKLTAFHEGGGDWSFEVS